MKLSNPELSFPEATKLMGQEWSDLSSEEKEARIINSLYGKTSAVRLPLELMKIGLGFLKVLIGGVFIEVK